MKKTISINIAGQVFHIEEDGFDKLRTYLNSIQRYFASYEDSKEILSDIEGRVAERFMNKQKATDTQALSLTDVEELIKAMGTVTDFEAVEEEEDLAGSRQPMSTEKVTSDYQPSATQPEKTPPVYQKKPLVRDTKRKLLGGVCAGIAHYLNVDSLLVRLVFLFLFLGFPALGGIIGNGNEDVFGPLSGVIFLLYMALWVSFPGANNLEEDKSIKKFYRDSESKVVGGVASGVAAYFGIDPGVVRLLWVVSIAFFGIGLLLYLVLWSITPLAKTLTEKMEMTGQPITLENIETNVRRALQPEISEENTFTKLLLLPFRAIAAVFQGLTPLLKFVVVIARVFAGLILMLMGGSVVIGLLVALFAFLGFSDLPFGGIDEDFMPLNFFLNEVPSLSYVFLFLAVAIPFAAVAWAGVSLLARQNKFTATTWQTMLGLFLVGILGVTFLGIKYGANFRRDGNVEQTKEYSLPNQPLLLGINQNQPNDSYRHMSFLLEGHDANNATVVLEMAAQGRSRTDAEKNARMVVYNVTQKDSALVFDEHFTLADKARFRAQRLNAKLYLPYNKPFAMTADFYNQFGSRGLNYSYDLDDENEALFKKLRWAMKPDSGLVCLNRSMVAQENNEDGDDENQELGSVSANIDQNVEEGLGTAFEESFNQETRGEYVKQFEVKDFTQINISGAYVVKIQQGAVFKVTADGRESDVEKLTVKTENGVLRVQNQANTNLMGNSRRIGLTITLPTLKAINLAGAMVARVEGFSNIAKLDVDIAGSSKVFFNINVQELDLSVSGNSKLFLQGKAVTFNADLAGACSLDATALKVENADVSASGMSQAELGKIPNLKTQIAGVGRIESQK